MITPKFRLSFEQKDSKGYGEYIIVTKEGYQAGLITFFVEEETIHIYNIHTHEMYRKEVQLTKWIRSFNRVFAYDVVSESIAYWNSVGAYIVNYIEKPKFEDIVFLKDEE